MNWPAQAFELTYEILTLPPATYEETESRPGREGIKPSWTGTCCVWRARATPSGGCQEVIGLPGLGPQVGKEETRLEKSVFAVSAEENLGCK